MVALHCIYVINIVCMSVLRPVNVYRAEPLHLEKGLSYILYIYS